MARIVMRKDGRYMARLQAAGRRFTVYGRTEAECREKLAMLERQLLLGQPPIPAKLTVAQWLETWFETEAPRWRPRTRQNYRTLLDRVILPRIGHLRLAKLSPVGWQRFFDSLEGRAASQAFAVIRRAGNVAVRWRWLPENPTTFVVPPRYQPTRRVLPNQAELARLFRFCLDTTDPAGLLVAFVLVTGLRVSEVAALEWGDIDWTAGLVHVRRCGQWLEGRRWVVGPPKTRAGERTIALGPVGLAILQRQRERVGQQGLVFARPGGLPLSYEYSSAAVRRLCRKAGLVVPLRFHDLRHATCSLLLANGTPLTEASRQLGHSSPQVTATIYAHAIASSRAAALAIEQALGG